jgi:molybdate transport system substrate-binding protein
MFARQMRWLVISGIVGMMLILAAAGGAAAGDQGTVTVFAAASTTNAVTEIGELFAAQNPERLVTSFASSSTLAKQIESGATAEIFISANPEWMDYLEERKLIEAGTRKDLLGNRIVLIVPADSGIDKVAIAPGFDLAGLLGDGRLAMGDPDHVPAGKYGKQALEHLGVWSGIEARVARAKDVRAALTLVERGEAPAGVVYSTDAAVSDRVRAAGTFPADSHPAIAYPVAVVAGKRSPAVDRCLALLQSEAGRAVFAKYGFMVR